MSFQTGSESSMHSILEVYCIWIFTRLKELDKIHCGFHTR